eukprot:Amastigsp_a845590_56.p3 type:complete len:127 gc:universal Amastigsp_a845590_56:282-662(+)
MWSTHSRHSYSSRPISVSCFFGRESFMSSPPVRARHRSLALREARGSRRLRRRASIPLSDASALPTCWSTPSCTRAPQSFICSTRSCLPTRRRRTAKRSSSAMPRSLSPSCISRRRAPSWGTARRS